jgi:hypothetical protein
LRHGFQEPSVHGDGSSGHSTKPNLKALTKTVTRLKSTNAPFLLTMPLEVIEESHETEIHVELLVAVEEREAWIVGDKVYFGFLIAA